MMQQKPTNNLNLLALRRQYTNPHGLYDAIRALDSIYFDGMTQCWLVTGYNAVTTLLNDTRFISGLGQARKTSYSQMWSVNKQMLFMDGEEHLRTRSVLLKPLSSMVKQMPFNIREFVYTTLTAAGEKGEMEFVSELASPVSLLTIAHVLGLPLDDQEELRQLERWSDTYTDMTTGYFRNDTQDIKNLEEYFRRLIAKKRQMPSDDLLSAFIEAEDVFTNEEALIANCIMVFSAGRTDVKKLLANGITLLMHDWKHCQIELRKNRRLPRLLGEELLRMVTPARCIVREANEDVDLSSLFPGNHLIRRGQRVLLFLEAANYDPTVFSEPQRFHPHRHPNKHIAFGYGSHQCPGAALARLEIQQTLEEILSLPGLYPKPGTAPIWSPNPNFGSFISNFVVFETSC